MGEQLKLVRGVIYDMPEILIDEREYLIDEIAAMPSVIREGFKRKVLDEGWETQQNELTADMVVNIIVGTLERDTRKLIIPENLINKSLRDELKKIDLGEGLVERVREAMQQYNPEYEIPISEDKIVPEEICEEDELLSLLENFDENKLIKIPKDSPLGQTISKSLGIA